MALADVPHFRVPFDFEEVGGEKRAAEVEQDSAEEVIGCVETVLRYPKGFRDDLPEFGVEELNFRIGRQGDRVRRAVSQWEPRADLRIEELDPLEEAVRRIRLTENEQETQ